MREISLLRNGGGGGGQRREVWSGRATAWWNFPTKKGRGIKRRAFFPPGSGLCKIYGLRDISYRRKKRGWGGVGKEEVTASLASSDSKLLRVFANALVL